jgi:hypothetical protein
MFAVIESVSQKAALPRAQKQMLYYQLLEAIINTNAALVRIDFNKVKEGYEEKLKPHQNARAAVAP